RFHFGQDKQAGIPSPFLALLAQRVARDALFCEDALFPEKPPADTDVVSRRRSVARLLALSVSELMYEARRNFP
ncbi:MAG: hypothetical protein N2049_08275, partial [Anaerolineales bacterium]|nr:hypothetical protein [Anaerolineales bacterium]